MAFQKVQRKSAKMRVALAGPSGAGKTLSALYLAYGVTQNWEKIALIDTEHGRGQFYGNRSDLEVGEYLYQELTPPFTAERYIAIAKEAQQAVGTDGVVIIDSFSHAWEGEGGVLDFKESIEQQAGKNSFTAWNDAGKKQNLLINSLLSLDCHVIVTMRTKMAYTMEQNERGKTVPVKLGLAPVQRENTEYEFDLVLNIARNHIAIVSKDTTFLDSWTGIITPELGISLRDWLADGVEPQRCTDCGLVITGNSKKTADEIANGTLKNYGRCLCWKCMTAEIKKLKEQKANAETVSD
ncbi:MAG: ATP-binding protein [Ruminococcus flavefaciens]|nr:ATP-binding protein [Ruminococcus flavefaciens]MCM1061820.1 ATP-binding protein [Eubacterium sp.]